MRLTDKTSRARLAIWEQNNGQMRKTKWPKALGRNKLVRLSVFMHRPPGHYCSITANGMSFEGVSVKRDRSQTENSD